MRLYSKHAGGRQLPIDRGVEAVLVLTNDEFSGCTPEGWILLRMHKGGKGGRVEAYHTTTYQRTLVTLPRL